MNALRCLRAVAQPAASATALLRPSFGRISNQWTNSSTRSFSLLSMRRPEISTSSLPSTTPNALPSAEALDLAPKVSSHPGLATTQIRCGPRNTYNPSHFVRKRRHGFLSRLRTKNGRKLLMRRIKKGRWNLSH